MELKQGAEEAEISRWAQIAAGVVLLPFALICLIGSLGILWLPNVRAQWFLQLFTGLMGAASLWATLTSVRLILGLRGRHGLLGPLALRRVAIFAVVLIVVGVFTGAFWEEPRTLLLAVGYLIVSVRLWRRG